MKVTKKNKKEKLQEEAQVAAKEVKKNKKKVDAPVEKPKAEKAKAEKAPVKEKGPFTIAQLAKKIDIHHMKIKAFLKRKYGEGYPTEFKNYSAKEVKAVCKEFGVTI